MEFRIGHATFQELVLQSASGAVSVGVWHHVFASANTTAGPGSRLYHLFLDGVDLTPSIFEDFGAAPLVYIINGNSFGIPSYAALTSTKLDMYDFWLAYDQFLGISKIVNFMNMGVPVFLGVNGELPSGTSPTYFFHDGIFAFANNLGTGDSTTLTGLLTQAPPPPPGV